MDKQAAGGLIQGAMQLPGAAMRAAMFPISLPAAHYQPTPDNPKALVDRIDTHKMPWGGAKSPYGDQLIMAPSAGSTFASRGSGELSWGAAQLATRNPELYRELAQYLTKTKQEHGSSLPRRLGRTLVEQASVGLTPIPSSLGNFGELGKPRHLMAGLSAKNPSEPAAFWRRWLFPRAAGAETMGRSLATLNPSLGARLHGALDKAYAKKPSKDTKDKPEKKAAMYDLFVLADSDINSAVALLAKRAVLGSPARMKRADIGKAIDENVIQPIKGWAQPHIDSAVNSGVSKHLQGLYNQNQHWMQPALYGAGIGGVLGLGSGLLGRKRKGKAIGDALTGAALGGLVGGVGGHFMNRLPADTAPSTPTGTDVDVKTPPTLENSAVARAEGSKLKDLRAKLKGLQQNPDYGPGHPALAGTEQAYAQAAGAYSKGDVPEYQRMLGEAEKAYREIPTTQQVSPSQTAAAIGAGAAGGLGGVFGSAATLTPRGAGSTLQAGPMQVASALGLGATGGLGGALGAASALTPKGIGPAPLSDISVPGKDYNPALRSALGGGTIGLLGGGIARGVDAITGERYRPGLQAIKPKPDDYGVGSPQRIIAQAVKDHPELAHTLEQKITAQQAAQPLGTGLYTEKPVTGNVQQLENALRQGQLKLEDGRTINLKATDPAGRLNELAQHMQAANPDLAARLNQMTPAQKNDIIAQLGQQTDHASIQMRDARGALSQIEEQALKSQLQADQAKRTLRALEQTHGVLSSDPALLDARKTLAEQEALFAKNKALVAQRQAALQAAEQAAGKTTLPLGNARQQHVSPRQLRAAGAPTGMGGFGSLVAQPLLGAAAGYLHGKLTGRSPLHQKLYGPLEDTYHWMSDTKGPHLKPQGP